MPDWIPDIQQAQSDWVPDAQPAWIPDTPKRTFGQKATAFLTMGHIEGEYGPESEVKFDAQGNMIRSDVPTGDPGFFQDPITALTMGGVAGARAAVNPIRKAAKEAIGWFTSGGSEAPALVKAGAKGIVKGATKSVEIKNLAKAAEARAGKPFAEIPIPMGKEIAPATRIIAETTPQASRVVTPELPEKPASQIARDITEDLSRPMPNRSMQASPKVETAKQTYAQELRSQYDELVAANASEDAFSHLYRGSGEPVRSLPRKGETWRQRADRVISELEKKEPVSPGGKQPLTKANEVIEGEYVWQNTVESIPRDTVDLLENAGRFFTEKFGKNELSKTGRYSTNLLTHETAPYATGGKGGAKFGVTNRGEGIHDTWAKTNGLEFVPDSADAWNVHNAYHEWLHSKMKGVNEATIQKEAVKATQDYFKQSPASLIPEVKGGATGELPKYAEGSAINLERLNTTNDVKQFINQRTTELEQKIGKRKVSWDETRAQAEALGWDKRAIEKEWKKKGSFTAAEIDATRQTNLNAIEKLHESIRNLPADRTTLTPEIRAQVLDAMDTIKVTSQATSEAGRALNIHKRVLSNDPSFTEAAEMQRVLRVIGEKGGKRTDDLINRLRDLDFGDIAAVNRFVYDASKTKWQKLSDGAYELWINGLLSNPLTHIVNTTSNALTMAYSYPERLLGAGIEAVRAGATGTKRGIFIGETGQDIFSISKGLTDAVNRFTHAMRYGERKTKLDYAPSALPDSVAKYMPTRALIAEDAFFKGFIENQELNRLAYRQAMKEGRRGAAFQDRITELLSHPTEQMLNDVARRGQYLTYQKEVGEVGRLIFNARDKVPGLKYFIPFVKTPMNIAKFALERTPLNLPRLAARAVRGDLKGAQLSEELAKPLMGTMLATATYQLAENGYITGGMPKNKAEREEKLNTGWQPYSVKIGDKYYSYGRLEPLGSIMGMAADMSQIKQAQNEDEKYNIALGIVGSINTNISNKVFMQGFTNMINAISDPGRYFENTRRMLTGSLIPAVSGGVARSVDENIRDIRGPVDTIKSRIPGVSGTLPGKLTVWGEPLKRPGSAVGRFLSPMQISQEKGSPIERELVKLDLDIGYPSRKIKGYDLSQDEYWQLVKAAGEPAKRILDKLATSPRWDTMDNNIKEKVVSTIVGQFRDAERRKMEARLIREGKIKVVP